jgi:hypothetical protein
MIWLKRNANNPTDMRHAFGHDARKYS